MMIPQRKFNYEAIINKSKLVNKKIDFNSDYIKTMKKNQFLTSIFNRVMDFNSYNKLKKISNTKYEVYKYVGNIDAIYISTKKTTLNSFNENFRFAGVHENGYILIVNNQKIYLDGKTYKELMYDKKIILYFAKSNNLCVLFDYERILNEEKNVSQDENLIKNDLIKSGKMAFGKIIKVLTGETEINDMTQIYNYNGSVFLVLEFLSENGKKYQILTPEIKKEKYNEIALNKEFKISYDDSKVKSQVGKYIYIKGKREKMFYFDTICFYVEEIDCIKK